MKESVPCQYGLIFLPKKLFQKVVDSENVL